jgi:hypothetical protein
MRSVSIDDGIARAWSRISLELHNLGTAIRRIEECMREHPGSK